MSVLDEITARKKLDVSGRMEKMPLESIRRSASPTVRSLASELSRPGVRFILECKKASPSEGIIRKDFDIDEIANAYKNHADAVSVLTDEPYFQGRLDYLKRARELLDCPILAKDFVISPYQVAEARVYGADAVLLMLSVLDDHMYRRCADEASRLSMDVLTEVHDDAELARAISLDARLIGINNRNLRTLEVDINVVERLAPRIPDDRVVVCESGVKSHADVTRIRTNCPRVGAFLVGGALMKDERVDLAARRLIYGRVKICGLTSPEDVRRAYEAGASYGGMVFAPGSPRRVGIPEASEISASAPLPMVGVFVNEPLDAVSAVSCSLGFAAVQLHGDEDLEYVSRLRERLPGGTEIWKAVRVGERLPELDKTGADRVLLDTLDKNLRGGTGKKFDWSLLDNIHDKSRVILAGGVTPDNAAGAMKYGTYAIDVSSGVELPGPLSGPGRKDHKMIQRLFAALRGA